MNRSVLLASNCNVWREPFNGQSHAFLSVVAGVEQADLLAPPGLPYLVGHGVRPSVGYLLHETFYRLWSQARIAAGSAGLSIMEPTRIEQNYDLFFFVCQFPHELSALKRMHGWRKRSKLAVCYILETWSSSLQEVKANLKMLDDFDRVFVLNAQSIPELRRYTRAPLVPLAPAVDCRLAAPQPGCPTRSIDVYSFGRRSQSIHEQLMQLEREGGDFHYVYDSLRGGSVVDWDEHRMLISNFMKRSRYFTAFNPGDIGGGGKGRFKGEQALSTRYFEGAAGGAILLGTAPRCEEYDAAFDWEDALIHLDPDGDIRALLADLDRQPERLATASRRNVAECLRRHDWSHRWAAILDELGLPHTPALHERFEAMRRLAELTCP
ncbi:glycosyltransferase [Sphingomonas sp. BN140010]|uniref:Glycosyltransferase n=1 Tax=Sphingomonas arvum TaxID=2992113 RepID=A0ABT3JBZ7_9SPHN|nr:glycosyltransferase [Sphingomonas sp. BN140010]MCW3796559.1 glycosyltransferase [Sphingomonas sp. BN140010]